MEGFYTLNQIQYLLKRGSSEMRQGRDRPRQLFAGPDQFEEEKVPNGDQIIPSNANSAS